MALEDEINDCSYRKESGPRKRPRPQFFCESVTMESSLSVAGPTVLNDTSVTPPAITVGGKTYVPTIIQVQVGSQPGLDPEAPPVPIMGYIEVLASPVEGPTG